MPIGSGSYVQFRYVLRDSGGDLIEASNTDRPPSYIHGHRQIISGLERQMVGHCKGDRFTALVKPEDAYGPYIAELITIVPLKQIPKGARLEVGGTYDARNSKGESVKLVVREINEEEVVFDGNHPMAGKTLSFDITILEERPATPLERLTLLSPSPSATDSVEF